MGFRMGRDNILKEQLISLMNSFDRYTKQNMANKSYWLICTYYK